MRKVQKTTKKIAHKRTTAKRVGRRMTTKSEKLADQAARAAEGNQVFGRRASDRETVSAAKALESAQREFAQTVNTLKEVVTKTVPTKERAPSISRTAEELITAGKTDEEVLGALVKNHGLDPETKRHYPSWFRARLVRKNVITSEFANAHRHAEVQ